MDRSPSPYCPLASLATEGDTFGCEIVRNPARGGALAANRTFANTRGRRSIARPAGAPRLTTARPISTFAVRRCQPGAFPCGHRAPLMPIHKDLYACCKKR